MILPKTLLLLALTASAAFAAAELSLDSGTTPGAKTVILSETLEMVSGNTENTFYFSKNVRAKGNNLKLTADQVVVSAARAGEQKTGPIPSGGMGTIQKIVATGNVHIYQEGREATGGHAEFFPKDGKVVLTENPRVIDSKALVSGWRITLMQGERRVLVEQNPDGSARPTVNLENLPNMGFDPVKHPPEEFAPQPKPVAATPVVAAPAAPSVAPVAPVATPAKPAQP